MSHFNNFTAQEEIWRQKRMERFKNRMIALNGGKPIKDVAQLMGIGSGSKPPLACKPLTPRPNRRENTEIIYEPRTPFKTETTNKEKQYQIRTPYPRGKNFKQENYEMPNKTPRNGPIDNFRKQNEKWFPCKTPKTPKYNNEVKECQKSNERLVICVKNDKMSNIPVLKDINEFESPESPQKIQELKKRSNHFVYTPLRYNANVKEILNSEKEANEESENRQNRASDIALDYFSFVMHSPKNKSYINRATGSSIPCTQNENINFFQIGTQSKVSEPTDVKKTSMMNTTSNSPDPNISTVMVIKNETSSLITEPAENVKKCKDNSETKIEIPKTPVHNVTSDVDLEYISSLVLNLLKNEEFKSPRVIPQTESNNIDKPGQNDKTQDILQISNVKSSNQNENTDIDTSHLDIEEFFTPQAPSFVCLKRPKCKKRLYQKKTSNPEEDGFVNPQLSVTCKTKSCPENKENIEFMKNAQVQENQSDEITLKSKEIGENVRTLFEEASTFVIPIKPSRKKPLEKWLKSKGICKRFTDLKAFINNDYRPKTGKEETPFLKNVLNDLCTLISMDYSIFECEKILNRIYACSSNISTEPIYIQCEALINILKESIKTKENECHEKCDIVKFDLEGCQSNEKNCKDGTQIENITNSSTIELSVIKSKKGTNSEEYYVTPVRRSGRKTNKPSQNTYTSINLSNQERIAFKPNRFLKQ